MNPLSFDVDSTPLETALARLHEGLGEVERADVGRFRSALAKLAPESDTREASVREAVATLFEAMCASASRVEARRARRLALEYDTRLPILEARSEIEQAIAAHKVVVVAGETGSGKSTQLPKFLLGAGYGVRGRIGMTQPRRIAARAIAARLAEETRTVVGDAVGFTTRFDDVVGAATRVKVMTDGILLNEIHSDRRLERYDALVIDEAHERSLNIDFLLGYLKGLLARRDDLKVVVTSATIDPERFAAYFDDAPIIRVGGRGYPVEVRYEGPGDDARSERDRDMPTEIAAAVSTLKREGSTRVLVFLPGEREISETREHLKGALSRDTEILPLYSRLPKRAQDRVYVPATGPRVILATNVAETSLTVPGIDAVVDTGTARISRYSPRGKVQRLPVEPISRAAATQRAGRCGREAPGIAVRLYDESDFEARPEFTDPEILRTNLATVILKSKSLGIGDLTRFPFLDPPPPRLVRDGYRLLEELDALTEDGRRLTAHGRLLARLPIDPQLGRMIIEARRENAVREVTIIAAALSVQDPREFPADAKEAAAEAYRHWADTRSDFLWFVNFWDDAIAGRGSWNQVKRLCRERFISFMRVREWVDIHRQLVIQLKREGFRESDAPASFKAIHKCLVAGLVSNVSRRVDGHDYQLARGTRFRLARTSALSGKRAPWLVVMQVVETHRNTARLAAKIDPAWVASVARRQLVTEYGEVTWDAAHGEARIAASRRLFQHVVQPGLSLRLSSVDAALAKGYLVREGILAGQLPRRRPEVDALRARLASLAVEEARLRRREIVPDEATLAETIGACLPDDVTDARALFALLDRNPGALALDPEALANPAAMRATPEDTPEVLEVLGHRLPLSYRFEPGEPADGITVEVPLHLIGALEPEPFDRLVPGHLPEKLEAMLRTLPKAQRKRLQPIGEKVTQLAESLPGRAGPLAEAVAAWLSGAIGESVSPAVFDTSALPPHLLMRFRVVDDEGRECGVGRDLAALQSALESAGRAAFTEAAHTQIEKATPEPVTRWVWNVIDEVVEIGRAAPKVRAYPAVTDLGDAVELEVYQDADEAARAHARGVLRLALIEMRRDLKYARRQLPYTDAISLAYVAFGDVSALKEDLVVAVVRDLMDQDARPVRTREDFELRLGAARREFLPALTAHAERVRDALTLGAEIRKSLADVSAPELVEEISAQLESLIGDGFLARFPLSDVAEFPRYLRATARRIERFGHDPAKDRRKAAQVAPFAEALARQRATGDVPPDKLSERAILVEEFRVSLFAQELGTRQKVSPDRLQAALST